MTADVVVLGDVVTDVVAHLDGAATPGSDTPARVRIAGGGSAANVAWWLAASGVGVTLVARVGDDEAGRERSRELEAAGVRARLAVDGRRPTGAIVVFVDAAGERTMLTQRGANQALAPADLPDALLAGAAHLHLSGYVLLDPGSRAAGLDALARARDHGLTVSVDPSSHAPLEAAGPQRFLEWTAGSHLVLPNAAEARLLTGLDDPEAAGRALARRYGEAVVTLGRAGALWSDGRRTLRQPAPARVATDTTGAGDALAAGFLAARLAGADAREALARGTALAARAVGTPGARTPTPARSHPRSEACPGWR